MNGPVAVGGMKVNDSASYCAAACWAGVIDNEVHGHVSSLSLWTKEDTQKGPLRLWSCVGARMPCVGVSIELSSAASLCEFVETRWVNYPQYPQDQFILLVDGVDFWGWSDLPNKNRPEAVRSYGGIALSWQGNSFSSSRAASGPTLTISGVESGDLVSGLIISPSP